MKTPARYAAFLLASLMFLINPGFGCAGGDEDDFEFGEGEMRAAVEGSWRVRTAEGTLVLVLSSAPAPGAQRAAGTPALVRPAGACGSRDFFKPAAACVSSSVLHLAGTVAVEGQPGERPATGAFSVFGKRFTTGMLEVDLGDGRKLTSTQVDRSGSRFAASLSGSGQTTLVQATLERLPR